MKNWGKRKLLTLQISESLYENCLGWTCDVYSFYILLHVYVTSWVFSTVSPPPPPPPLRQRLRSISAVAPSLQLNCGKSWQVSIVNLQSVSWQSIKEALRTPALMKCVPAVGQPDRLHSIGRTFRDACQFFSSFCIIFFDQSALLVAPPRHGWTANAWLLTLCAS